MMIRWYAQEQPTSCVAACIRMVLSSFSQTCTELQIRQMIGTPRLGISLGAAAVRLNQNGVTSHHYEDWSLDDLRDAIREKHLPIVGIERHLLGYEPASHAVVIVTLTSIGVEILDPLDGPQPNHFGITAFQQSWNYAGQEALIIEVPLPATNKEKK